MPSIFVKDHVRPHVTTGMIQPMGNNKTAIASNVEIDAYDLAILSALSDNASLTTIELSKIVHLSRTAVARRVTKLADMEVLEPARATVNYERLGFAVRAFVEVAAPRHDSFDVRDKLLDRPEVLNLSIVLGESLILAEIITVDTKHLHRFLTWLNDIGYSETKVVLQKHRSRMSFRSRLAMIERENAVSDPRLTLESQES
jgi:DNA-binding Lrp family transcriptional regulator